MEPQRYEATFLDGRASQQQFEQLLERASSVEVVADENEPTKAFLAAGAAVVERSDSVVAVWDGLEAKGEGGPGTSSVWSRRGASRCCVSRPMSSVSARAVAQRRSRSARPRSRRARWRAQHNAVRIDEIRYQMAVTQSGLELDREDPGTRFAPFGEFVDWCAPVFRPRRCGRSPFPTPPPAHHLGSVDVGGHRPGVGGVACAVAGLARFGIRGLLRLDRDRRPLRHRDPVLVGATTAVRRKMGSEPGAGRAAARHLLPGHCGRDRARGRVRAAATVRRSGQLLDPPCGPGGLAPPPGVETPRPPT